MKKLIAIAIVFALAAGAAFADTAIGAGIEVRATLVDHTLGRDGTQPTTEVFVPEGSVSFTATNDDGDFGAKLRLKPLKAGAHTHSSSISLVATTDYTDTNSNNAWDVGETLTASGQEKINRAALAGSSAAGAFELFDQAWAWWKPFDALEIFIGKDADGKFGFYNAWSHFKGNEGYQHIHDWGKWRAAAAFTNWDTFGIALILKPIDGLAVNIVIPSGGQLRNVYGGNLQFSATYDIDSIGQAFFGYKLPGANIFAEGYKGIKGQIGAGFQLDGGIVDGLDVQAGFSTYIPGSKDVGADKVPVHFFLKANYVVNSEFGIQTRWRLTLEGNGDAGDLGNNYKKDSTEFAFDIMPYYDLGFMTAYLNLGLRSYSSKSDMIRHVDKDGVATTEESFMVFNINPYVRKSLGAGYIRAGILLEFAPVSRGSATGWWYVQEKGATKFKVPVAFGYSF